MTASATSLSFLVPTDLPGVLVDVGPLVERYQNSSSPSIRIVCISNNPSQFVQMPKNTVLNPEPLTELFKKLFADYRPTPNATEVKVQITHSVSCNARGSGSLRPQELSLQLQQTPS